MWVPALIQIQTWLLALQPYELPEPIAVETDFGHSDYLLWIAAQTRPDQTHRKD
jgi:uncharacterized protein involved in tolerance to divalent cations